MGHMYLLIIWSRCNSRISGGASSPRITIPILFNVSVVVLGFQSTYVATRSRLAFTDTLVHLLCSLRRDPDALWFTSGAITTMIICFGTTIFLFSVFFLLARAPRRCLVRSLADRSNDQQQARSPRVLSGSDHESRINASAAICLTPNAHSACSPLLEVDYHQGESELSISNLSHHQKVADLTGQVSLKQIWPVANGGFSYIYHGLWQCDDKVVEVAVKVPHSMDSIEKMQAVTRWFLRETDLWQRLKHKNILPLYGLVSNLCGPGTFGMVCPWIANGNLTQYLMRSPSLSFSARLRILDQIASAMIYLHSHSVVHGDVTGNNMLVDGAGDVLLCDFGLSSDRENLCNTSTAAMFNLRWTAPERIPLIDNSVTTYRTRFADIYSFGSVALQVLTGRIPYHGLKDGTVLLHLDAGGGYPPRPDTSCVSDGLWELMLRCWEKVPEERISMAAVGAFLHRLRAAES